MRDFVEPAKEKRMPSFVLNRIINLLPRFGYRFGDEKQLHDGIATVLGAENIGFVREAAAGPKDRFDFLCEDGVVIEAKIKGSFTEAINQIDRYMQNDAVAAVVLVTTRQWGTPPRLRKDPRVRGKPVRFVTLRSQAF